MKKILMGILALGMLGGSALTASAQEWRHDRDWRNDRREDRDIQRDQRKIDHDRWELRRAEREGNYRAAEHERRELRNEYRDINRDRAERWRDSRYRDHDAYYRYRDHDDYYRDHRGW